MVMDENAGCSDEAFSDRWEYGVRNVYTSLRQSCYAKTVTILLKVLESLILQYGRNFPYSNEGAFMCH